MNIVIGLIITYALLSLVFSIIVYFMEFYDSTWYGKFEWDEAWMSLKTGMGIAGVIAVIVGLFALIGFAWAWLT